MVVSRDGVKSSDGNLQGDGLNFCRDGVSRVSAKRKREGGRRRERSRWPRQRRMRREMDGS